MSIRTYKYKIANDKGYQNNVSNNDNSNDNSCANYGTIKSTDISRSEQFKKQEEIIDVLGPIVTDIKQIANNMNNELDKQKDVVIDITYRVDNTDNGINRATDRVKILVDDNSFCGCRCLLIVCFLFFVALVVCAIVLTVKLDIS